ncbi:hypothetical protein OKW41_005337 [Paraburkholderia sp. UCT70]|uniref:hypothetical protein n=1 Tax=Paraburkholderia sp. UCT70 TaxID=2991068 RepID=UPI003D222AA7
MRFEYEETTRTAIDRENKITIRMSSKFYDTDHLNFEYADEHIEFVFAAYEATEKRIARIRGIAREYPMAVAMYVVEQTVKRGARIWPVASPIRQERYSEIRRAVEYGMFALCTLGGKRLDWVPDYRVEYIPDFSNIPQLRS